MAPKRRSTNVLMYISFAGCHRLADFLESIQKDFEKAAKVFQTNCDDNNYAHSCYKFGNYKVLGRGTCRP